MATIAYHIHIKNVQIRLISIYRLANTIDESQSQECADFKSSYSTMEHLVKKQNIIILHNFH